jgi:hypothetical protein
VSWDIAAAEARMSEPVRCSGWLFSAEAGVPSAGDRSGSGRGAQLAEDARHVVAGCLGADEERGRYVCVAPASCEQGENLGLTGGQSGKGGGRTVWCARRLREGRHCDLLAEYDLPARSRE